MVAVIANAVLTVDNRLDRWIQRTPEDHHHQKNKVLFQ